MIDGVFAFETPGAALTLLPLAARLALDVCGLKLSLAGWTSLSEANRRVLVSEGTREHVDVDAVNELVRNAFPAATPIVALDVATLEPLDPEAARLLLPNRKLGSVWPGLSMLARFALSHLAKRGDPERLAGAYDELVGGGPRLTHLDAKGAAHMVDVGAKSVTQRRAVARARLRMRPETAQLILERGSPKGDVGACARIAGIMGSKRTSDLIPLCHPIALTHVALDLSVDAPAGLVTILATTETRERTGVEMEAMVAASVAALTIYDMLKGIERGIAIEQVVLLEKDGGRSGNYRREDDA